MIFYKKMQNRIALSLMMVYILREYDARKQVTNGNRAL